ncbi:MULTISPECIES: dCTP deaminase [Halorussus]|uniref:dCTP deaminase n=1 Tax=Halorussus TaxID=1070314 RepID=UPI00209CDAB7|nr:dCTP deaminase [Halorussus vallis]USZ77826.1 dCTP deaminase [Halorussus vallis]
MRPSELTTFVEGLLHEETQVTERGLDLTAAEIYEIAEPGRVDFGGGELEDARLEPHDKEWRDEDDDYRWWHLDGGQYLLEYNESFATDRRLTVQTRDELRERGAFHPTLEVQELRRVPLSVAAGGLRIKENARVSTLLSPEEGAE